MINVLLLNSNSRMMNSFVIGIFEFFSVFAIFTLSIYADSDHSSVQLSSLKSQLATGNPAVQRYLSDVLISH